VTATSLPGVDVPAVGLHRTDLLAASLHGTNALATSLPSAPVLAAACVGALVAIATLALVMRSDPRAFPVLAVLALPFRLPVSADGRTVNLLLPLYAVIAAGTLVHLLPRLLTAGRAQRATPALGIQRAPGSALARWRTGAYESGRPPVALDWLLLAAVALYALQAVYSADPGKAAENVAFFYLPFGLLYLLLRDAPWTRELLLTCLGVAVGLAILFAGVGFVEYYRKVLFLNPKVVAANEYDNYFRVNSLFFDPSIYGRFLAMVTIAVTTVVLWARDRREQWIGAGVLTWLLLGLVTSFSQSSIAALLLGLAVLAAWRWDVRATVYVSLALAAVALVVVVAAPPSLHFGLKGSGGSANTATSGRAKLVSGGLKLFAERPLAGWGSGSFETQYKRHGGGTAQNATSASHTIPVTVAAEQGVLGLALYVALVVCALLTLSRGAGRSPPRIALAACFAALVLHTWVYADFLEDPITWTLLGVGVALAVPPGGAPSAGEPGVASTTQIAAAG
jgi:O-antigen ligase